MASTDIKFRKKYNLRVVSKESKIPKNNSKRRSNPSQNDEYTPIFFSRNEILGLNLDHHIESLKDHLDEKYAFFQKFQSVLNQKRTIDFSVFQSPECAVFFEPSFIQALPKANLPDLRGLRIAAVDGGLGMREYLGVSLSMIKVSVVSYEFNERGIPTITKFPPPKYDANYAFYTDVGDSSRISLSQLASLRRTTAENSMLLNYLQNCPSVPDLVILDGSLLPPPQSKTINESSKMLTHYRACVASFMKLYNFCLDQGIIIIGSVKDSKSRVLRNILLRALPKLMSTFPSLEKLRNPDYRAIMKQYLDPELIYHLLPTFSRTSVFRYDFGLDIPQIFPTDFSEFVHIHPILSSYCQISAYDLPLRIEFLHPSGRKDIASYFNTILKMILPLTTINPQCTLPVPQIEAHIQAHIQEEEMKMVAELFENRFQRHYLQTNHSNNRIVDKGDTNSTFRLWLGTFFKKRHDQLDRMF